MFGEIANQEMILSPYGEIVQKWWEEIPVHFPNVETGAFVVMPNHVHGIIYILDGRGAVSAPDDNIIKNTKGWEIPKGHNAPPLQVFNGTPTLGQIIAYFKYQATKEMN